MWNHSLWKLSPKYGFKEIKGHKQGARRGGGRAEGRDKKLRRAAGEEKVLAFLGFTAPVAVPSVPLTLELVPPAAKPQLSPATTSQQSRDPERSPRCTRVTRDTRGHLSLDRLRFLEHTASVFQLVPDRGHRAQRPGAWLAATGETECSTVSFLHAPKNRPPAACAAALPRIRRCRHPHCASHLSRDTWPLRLSRAPLRLSRAPLCASRAPHPGPITCTLPSASRRSLQC